MILLLGGTTEGRQIAERMARAGLAGIVSLSGATRDPGPLPLPRRRGGFGGAEPFRAYLRDTGITRVIDATHPFARRISERTVAICRELGLPCLHVRRPEWRPEPEDEWYEIDRPEDAAALIPAGARVFLATGRQSLPDFRPIAPGRHLILRQIDPPLEHSCEVEVITGRPPHSQADEELLFRRMRVDWLVTKNSGGAGGRGKLHAARALRLPVAMLRRPAVPGGVRVVSDVRDAMDWLNRPA